MLKIAREPLSEIHLKEFHKILKYNTSDAKKEWFEVGAYKLKPNIVGGIETSKPNEVEKHIRELLKDYNDKSKFEIIDFHYEIER